MQITIDTSVPLSETDLSILLELAKANGGAPAAAKAPAAKAPKAAAVAPAPEEAPQLAVVPDPEPEAARTLDEAVKLATQAVAAGRTADVKAALAKAGAKKVSELSGNGIAVFLDTLGA